jgi:four helix bundle protein
VLDICAVILSFVADVAELTPRIAHHDPDLARQLRRAASAVALNSAEAMYARGRSRTACFNIALHEMRECYAALEVSVLLRYLPPLRAELEDRIQRIVGTLYRLSFPRQIAAR